MTNSSPSFARKGGERLRSFRWRSLASAFAVSLIAGCGPSDGVQELADGRAAFERADYKRAEKLLTKSAECNPASVDACVLLAQLKMTGGDIPAAKEWISRAEDLAAGDTDVRLLGAQIAWHANDYEKAERLFAGIAEDAELAPEIRSQGWTGLGIVQVTRNEHDLARVSYLRAIRLDRRNASARYHLGHLYRYAPFGYPEAALEQFDAFVHLAGAELSSVRVQKTQQKIIPELRETVNRAATERPGVAQRNSATSAAAISKAEAAMKKGNYKAARIAYQEALTADPLSYPAALGLAQTELKADASVAGQRKALEAYRTACSLKPSAVKTLIEAGQLAERLASYVQAREIYSRAVAANPASLDAIDGLIRSIRKANGDRKIAQAYQGYRDILPVPGKRK